MTWNKPIHTCALLGPPLRNTPAVNSAGYYKNQKTQCIIIEHISVYIPYTIA